MSRRAKWIRRTILTLLCVLALLWLIQFILPLIVHRQLRQRLEAAGFAPVSMTVDNANFTSATIRDLAAGQAISARVIHVTYSPLSLLRGQVGQIAVEGARLDLSYLPANPPAATRPSTASAPPTTTSRPLFQRATVGSSTIRLPATAPLSEIPFTIDAAGDTRAIHLNIQAEFGPAQATLTGTFDPGFSQGSLQLNSAVNLQKLSDLLAGAGTTTGQLNLSAKGNLVVSPLSWQLDEARLTAARTSLQFQNSPLAISDLNATLALAGEGTSNSANLRLLNTTALSVGTLQLPGHLPAFSASVLPRETSAQFNSSDWQIDTSGAQISLGDISFDVQKGRFAVQRGQARGELLSVIDFAVIDRSKLLESAFPALPAMDLTGKLELRLTHSSEGGIRRPAATLTLRDGGIKSATYQLEATGIEAQVGLLDLANPHSPPGQLIRMKYGQMGKWEVRDAQFQFTVKDLGTLAVEKTQLGWAGGILWTDPYELVFASPIIRTRVYAEELDLGKIVWVLSAEKAWAEGKVRMNLPVTFLWPRMRFGDGLVQAHPGGVLHLDYAANELSKYLVAADPRFSTDPTYAKIRERIGDALLNFQFKKLQAGFKRDNEQHLQTVLQIQGKGKGDEGQGLNLNVTISDVDWLLSKYLSLPKAKE